MRSSTDFCANKTHFRTHLNYLVNTCTPFSTCSFPLLSQIKLCPKTDVRVLDSRG